MPFGAIASAILAPVIGALIRAVTAAVASSTTTAVVSRATLTATHKVVTAVTVARERRKEKKVRDTLEALEAEALPLADVDDVFEPEHLTREERLWRFRQELPLPETI